MALYPSLQLKRLGGHPARQSRAGDGHHSFVRLAWWFGDAIDAEELEEFLDHVELHRGGTHVVVPPQLAALEA